MVLCQDSQRWSHEYPRIEFNCPSRSRGNHSSICPENTSNISFSTTKSRQKQNNATENVHMFNPVNQVSERIGRVKQQFQRLGFSSESVTMSLIQVSYLLRLKSFHIKMTWNYIEKEHSYAEPVLFSQWMSSLLAIVLLSQKRALLHFIIFWSNHSKLLCLMRPSQNRKGCWCSMINLLKSGKEKMKCQTCLSSYILASSISQRTVQKQRLVHSSPVKREVKMTMLRFVPYYQLNQISWLLTFVVSESHHRSTLQRENIPRGNKRNEAKWDIVSRRTWQPFSDGETITCLLTKSPFSDTHQMRFQRQRSSWWELLTHAHTLKKAFNVVWPRPLSNPFSHTHS